MDLTRRHADDDPSEERAFRLYEDDPMADGDALLLLDGTVCLELAGMADNWDDLGRRNLVEILTTTAHRVQVAIARERSDLRPATTSCGASCTRACATPASSSCPYGRCPRPEPASGAGGRPHGQVAATTGRGKAETARR